MGKKKTMRPDFRGAVATKDSAKAVLDAAGIQAKYTVTLGDDGPRVDIKVGSKDLHAAREALPFTIGSATVRVYKDDK